jgi:excisionase family DNA binding protein
MKPLLNVEQFAAAVGISPKTVRQKVWKREVEFVRVGRCIRFRPEMVEKLIEQGTIPARKERR